MNWPKRLSLWIAQLILLFAGAAQAADNTHVLIVDLTLNYRHMGDTFVLQEQDGSFLVEEAVLGEWQISKPWPEAVTFREASYYAVDRFPGATTEFDQQNMTLHVSMPANLMPLRSVSLQADQKTAVSKEYGAYLDYDVNWMRQQVSGASSTYASFQPNIFGAMGIISANLSYQNYSQADWVGEDARSGMRVLSLTYSRDDPENMRSLQIGDIVTKSTAQGRALRIGGIQLATNFATQPTFVTYPLPSFYGETAVPTALDIYIDGRLRQTQQVEPGRYMLEDIPVVNGAGQMQVVARDALGRQQVFAQDFYVATELLRQGLSDYSFNLGALREDYGLENFRYGEIAGSATWRYGLRDELTVEGHGEFTTALAMIAGGAQYGLASGGTVSAELGVSQSDQGTGGNWQFGLREFSDVLNYNLEVSGSTRNFNLVGYSSAAPKLQLLASAGKNFYEYGSFGASVVHQAYYTEPSRTLIAASHSKTFSNALALTTFVSIVSSGERDFTAGIRFSMPFGRKYDTYGGVSTGGEGINVNSTFRRNPPAGNGFGYYGSITRGSESVIEAGADAQSNYGNYEVIARSDVGSGTSLQASTRGSLAYLSGKTSFSRDIRDAFAVVDVGGLEGVRVYAENQEIGRTGEDGKLFVPGLQPYYSNQLRIELDDLPMNAQIGSSKIETTPYYRSGVVVNFDVRVANNVMFRAVLPDGSPAPEGAAVRVRYPDDVLPVGRNGLVYLEGIDRSSEVEIVWGNQRCELDIPYPDTSAIITKLDDIECKPQLVN